MKGDFSRLNLFDPLKQYTRVLQQQGRVQLDADWNEQTDILLHYLRTLASDLIGPFGGPAANQGFGITAKPGAPDGQNKIADLAIGAGRYYVDGLLAETGETLYSGQQPYLPEHGDLPAAAFLVYLDVWERHVTFLQDDSLQEVALGGADTASRARLAWRVRVTGKDKDGKPVADRLAKKTDTNRDGKDRDTAANVWPDLVKSWTPTGRLQARARRGGDDTDPCTASPEASYRGLENQLYRVEVQDWDPAGTLWFRWSRENGSVVFAIEDLEGEVATLASLGRDDASGLKQGDWVEITDDDFEEAGIPGPLRRVKDVDVSRNRVTLEAPAEGGDLPKYGEAGSPGAREKHALLRRWDHRESPPAKSGPKPRGAVLYAVPAAGPMGEDGWLPLENGIQVRFQPGTFRPGDCWLIPARTATGDVEWPGPPDNPDAVLPHGVEHRYAPLALVRGIATGDVLDLRRKFAITVS